MSLPCKIFIIFNISNSTTLNQNKPFQFKVEGESKLQMFNSNPTVFWKLSNQKLQFYIILWLGNPKTKSKFKLLHIQRFFLQWGKASSRTTVWNTSLIFSNGLSKLPKHCCIAISQHSYINKCIIMAQRHLTCNRAKKVALQDKTLVRKQICLQLKS